MADNYDVLKRKEKTASRILFVLVITVSIAIAILTVVLISGL